MIITAAAPDFQEMNVNRMIARRDSRARPPRRYLRPPKNAAKTRPIRQHNQNAIAAGNALRAKRIPHAIGERGQFAIGYFVRCAPTTAGRPGTFAGTARSNLWRTGRLANRVGNALRAQKAFPAAIFAF